MSADIPTRAMTMITVLRICTRVLPNNLNCLLVLTPCICPPIKAPAKSNKLVALKLKGMASNIKENDKAVNTPCLVYLSGRMLRGEGIFFTPSTPFTPRYNGNDGTNAA